MRTLGLPRVFAFVVTACVSKTGSWGILGEPSHRESLSHGVHPEGMAESSRQPNVERHRPIVAVGEQSIRRDDSRKNRD